jgi:hypothetical protein
MQSAQASAFKWGTKYAQCINRKSGQYHLQPENDFSLNFSPPGMSIVSLTRTLI